jgi:serine/threonine protein kinase
VAIPPAQHGEWFASGLRVRGRYRVVSEIGAGAFGTVCLGEDESTGHRVAIRFLPRNFARTPQTAQVLRIAASASHAAMAPVLEFGELDTGQPFTVTEFVEGRRLSQMMSNRAPLDVPAALRIALELGGAVETLHNTGFVHGAVSPRNVVLLADGRVKLLDIELAGLRDARELEGLIDGGVPLAGTDPEGPPHREDRYLRVRRHPVRAAERGSPVPGLDTRRDLREAFEGRAGPDSPAALRRARLGVARRHARALQTTRSAAVDGRHFQAAQDRRTRSSPA